jgi:magnesium chelatase accessory protein
VTGDATADATARLNWDRDGRDWPNRAASVFIVADGLRWHVQATGLAAGAAPTLLLIHGTGGSLHSWHTLAPLVAPHFHVITVDLPGHAFTSAAAAAQMSLPGMSRALAALLRQLGAAPALVVGHSAGAAIAARMALDGFIAPRALVGINAALLPFHGVPGLVFAPIARLLAGATLVPRLFAWRAQDLASVERLIRRTGSTLDATGVALYARLVRSPGHVASALAMMANWDLDPLWADLPRLAPPLQLLVGANDATLPPAQATRVAARVPGARVQRLPGLGHLAHEEQPQLFARLVLGWARELKIVPADEAQGLNSTPVSGAG